MVRKIKPPRPVSCGIFLSYRCNSRCRHCMYACSPDWSDNWISIQDLEKIFLQLSDKILPSPRGIFNVSLNYGLHLTGGEPFLKYDLLLKAVELAKHYSIPSIFVETNSFWCVDDVETEEKLVELKQVGLNGILVSVNPFIVEHIPFERIERCVEKSWKIYSYNTMIYQYEFYKQFKKICLKSWLSFEEYMRIFGFEGLSYIELIPMGRACYKLRELFYKYPAKTFFKENCADSLLRDWHTHIDNYGNYITGYCGGISLGDARKLDNLLEEGVDLDERPILDILINGNLEELYNYALREFNYKEREDGYISKCDLCLDIRRCITTQSKEYPELSPREYYQHLNPHEGHGM